MNIIFKKLDKNEITDKHISQILSLEGEDGYTEDQIRCIWQDDSIINDNFVCLLNDEIVGDISFNPNSKRRNGSVFMVNLSVSPNYRRMGIAKNLIYTACKYYKDKNISLPMSVSVDKDNFGAISLYKKVGYEIKEPICDADEDDIQYIMESSIEKLLSYFDKSMLNNKEMVKS